MSFLQLKASACGAPRRLLLTRQTPSRERPRTDFHGVPPACPGCTPTALQAPGSGEQVSAAAAAAFLTLRSLLSPLPVLCSSQWRDRERVGTPLARRWKNHWPVPEEDPGFQRLLQMKATNSGTCGVAAAAHVPAASLVVGAGAWGSESTTPESPASQDTCGTTRVRPVG